MSDAKTIEVTVERTIPTSPGEAFDAWLNPEVPGNPWSMAEKLLLNPSVDGLFYWLVRGTPHYGRFTALERPGRIQHTWMSPNTSGLESTVTVTFERKGKETVMTLLHTGLPDTGGGRSHENGWAYFLDGFQSRFAQSGAA
jgi:uncharacterized protein YndB with AHSA1/START domain